MNQIKIKENYGVDNDGFQVYVAMLNDVGIIISHQEDNIDNIHLNVNIKDFKEIIAYLRDMKYDIEEIFFNMSVFQECDSYTLDIYFTENTTEKLKNILSQHQKELKKDMFNFFRYYNFYKMGLQLELYAGPDKDTLDIWNKNIEKIDNIAQKYIYNDYLEVEDKYGVDCFDNYIIPQTYSFFKNVKKLFYKEKNNTCDNCKYIHHLFYVREQSVIVPLNIPTNYFCTKTKKIIDTDDITFCNHYKQK